MGYSTLILFNLILSTMIAGVACFCSFVHPNGKLELKFFHQRKA